MTHVAHAFVTCLGTGCNPGERRTAAGRRETALWRASTITHQMNRLDTFKRTAAQPLHETTASLAEARQQVRSPPLQGADGKQVCCRPATAVKLLWPAVNPALGRRDFGDLGPIWVDIASETGTGRAPAGITKGFPTALISSDGEKVAQRTEGDKNGP